MRSPRRWSTAILIALALVVFGAVVFTRSWGNYRERLRALRAVAGINRAWVDTRALDAAQQLAPLAHTRTERNYAAEALRLADYAVDFAYAAALDEAAANPVPLTPETRAITARIQAATAAVAADKRRVDQLTRSLADASADAGDNALEQFDVASAQLELDQNDLDDAHQDLIRAGGDRRASIRRLRDQHDAAQRAAETESAAAGATSAAAPSIELTQSSSIVSQAQALVSFSAKRTLLRQALQDASNRKARLAQVHDSLARRVAGERIRPDTATALSQLQGLNADQKGLAELDKRIDNEQDLASVYGNWIAYIGVRTDALWHGILVSALWALIIALLVVGANAGVRRLFADVPSERRQLHTVRTILLFAVQVVGLLLILVVIFGMPSNLATIIALTGAGLTVALKDFIVGFFGWFVLMGKDGMRPGDWVEINGVGGEVLEVGVFQTVLLETGSWSESGNPTGRKVTFMNSFAIEGHYFNFSTAGQWLWDEVQAQVPQGSDPYAVAEAIQQIASDETAANAQGAEQEWQRVVPSYGKHTFTAIPSVSVRPSGSGVSVVVRYLARASERQEIRARLYRALIELSQPKPPAGGAGVHSSA